MSSKIKCPICGSLLKALNSRHIDSTKHQNALKKKGIPFSEDPTLKSIKKKISSNSSTKIKTINFLSQKIDNLEIVISEIKKNQNLILNILDSANLTPINNSKKKNKQKISLNMSDIKSAIAKCVQMNKNESLWVKLDDVIGILKISPEGERAFFNKLLIKMFSKNIVDLAEGGNPKYPLIFQNREYGMIALQ